MKKPSIPLTARRIAATALAAFMAVGSVPAQACAAEVLEADAEDLSVYAGYEQADEAGYQLIAQPEAAGETAIADEAYDTVWPDTITWEFSGGTLTIKGTGDMPRYIGYGAEPWKEHKDDVTKIVIGEGITGIGAYAFYQRKNVTEVKLPSTLKRIGPFAFGFCSSLKEIDLQCPEIGESAFMNCGALEKVTVGKNVKSFGITVFESCTGIKGVYISDLKAWCDIYFCGLFSNPLELGTNTLYLNGEQVTELTIPDGVKELKPLAFMDGKGIKKVTIPAGVETIGHWAFAGMTDLETVVLPDGLKKIDVAAFNSDSQLRNINFPSSLEYVGSYAFSCDPMEEVTIGQGYIGKCAFEGCGNLSRLNLGENVKYIGDNAFWDTGAARAGAQINYTNAPFRNRQTIELGSYNGDKLKWLVLGFKDNKALVVTEKLLAFEKYCDYGPLGESLVNDIAPDWSRSTIRTWLNDTFYNAAFTDAEKPKVQQVTLEDTGTEDRMFLLSGQEAEYYFSNNDDRQAQPSDYLMKNRIGTNATTGEANYGALYSATTKSSYWWLRSLGDETFNAQFVCYTGAVRPDGCGEANGDLLGIRPAMYVDAEEFGLINRDASIEAFVKRLYQLVLGREPDGAGFDDWVQKLNSKNVDGASLAHGFFFSKEFLEMNVSDEQFVDILYKVFFDSDGDAEGKAYWIKKLKQGYSRKYVLAGFINSDQYRELCKKFDIDRGTYKLSEADTERKIENLHVDVDKVKQYLTSLYMTILGREPDPAGFDYWIEQITSRKKTAAEVAMIGFFESEEYKKLNKSDAQFLEDLYMTMMGRPSDAQGKQYWIDKLKNGEYDRPRVIAHGFGHSDEFLKILQGYGLAMLPLDDEAR